MSVQLKLAVIRRQIVSQAEAANPHETGVFSNPANKAAYPVTVEFNKVGTISALKNKKQQALVGLTASGYHTLPETARGETAFAGGDRVGGRTRANGASKP